ncbi:MAG TPA: type II toxin-antitoxin system VapC family toxin [Lamprocystis sp. (in: g-proteobacteria)]|nr:type II toxin-antitoxin system VapC family toxin [Lamprocystis sp. (in: g-proteobacteria)]
MRILLDTHLVLWWQGMSNRVPAAVRALIDSAAAPPLVSQVSLWEIAIKVSQGRIKVDLPRFCAKVAEDGFTWLPIEQSHLLQVATVPVYADHKDPFDRLLVAQSLAEPLILLTVDAKLARYGTTVRVM